MKTPPHQNLSRRERQIMDAIYQLEQASVADIADHLPDAPTDTAIRTHLRILEEKGHVTSHKDGRRNVYKPRVSRKRAAKAAFSGVLSTFFGGSLGEAVAAHLSDPRSDIDEDDIKRLKAIIDAAEESSK